MSEASRIIDLLGGNIAVASALGVAPRAVSHWRHRGIPARFWLDVARMAQAAGHSEITPDTLRRPLWQRPDCAGAAA